MKGCGEGRAQHVCTRRCVRPSTRTLAPRSSPRGRGQGEGRPAALTNDNWQPYILAKTERVGWRRRAGSRGRRLKAPMRPTQPKFTPEPTTEADTQPSSALPSPAAAEEGPGVGAAPSVVGVAAAHRYRAIQVEHVLSALGPSGLAPKPSPLSSPLPTPCGKGPGVRPAQCGWYHGPSRRLRPRDEAAVFFCVPLPTLCGKRLGG